MHFSAKLTLEMLYTCTVPVYFSIYKVGFFFLMFFVVVNVVYVFEFVHVVYYDPDRVLLYRV